MRHLISSITRSALTVLLITGACAGQAVRGNIGGYVTDSSGAVIVGATVRLVHVETGETRIVTTNETGEFLAPLLPIGHYDLTAEYQGFKKSTLSGVQLSVNQTVMLSIILNPGAVTQTVQVQASPPLVNTSNSSIGQVIDNSRVVDMPLNGRNVFALGLLAGNTTQVTGTGTNQTFAAGGGRFSGNEIMLDGITDNTTTWNGAIGRNSVLFTPSVDALQEFKVITNNFSAEFGHAAGAVVSATIKSGTNEVHGTVFEFLRNDALDANNFFTNAAGRGKSLFRQNQFGFVLGGPVYIPKIYNGHNRTFFFVDYQGTRTATNSGSEVYSLPPVAFRAGDFSALGQTIYNPLSRRIGPTGAVIADPFPDNQILSNQISPTSLKIEALIPEPNFGAPGAVARNYFESPNQTTNGDEGDARLDQRITQANTLTARVSLSNLVEPAPGIFPGPLGGGHTQVEYGRSYELSDTQIFSPTVLNEFRFGFTRSNGSSTAAGPAGVAVAKESGLSLFPTPVQGLPEFTFSPTGQISGQTTFSSIGGGSDNLNIEETFETKDSVTIIRGNHTIVTGADIWRHHFDSLLDGFGQDVFGSIFSSSSNDPKSGSPWADFLMGYPALENPSMTMLAWGNQRSIYAGAFVQDNWKFNPRLTLNLGLRYDLYTEPVDAHNVGGMYSFPLQQFVVPGQDGFSRAILPGNHRDFSPRVGFAYQLTKHLVMRSGYGIFYGLRDQNDQTTAFAENIPNAPTLIQPTITASQTVAPPITVNTPIVFTPIDATLAECSAQHPCSYLVQTNNLSYNPDPYLQQWNYSLEYQPSRDWMLEAAYSGAKGTHLDSRINLGQVPFEYAIKGLNTQAYRGAPKINGVQGLSYGFANNEYEAVNFKLEKRFSKGFNLLANYTISKDLETEGSGDSSYSQNGNTSLPLYSFDLKRDNGPTPVDVPQVFVTSYSYELPFGKGQAFLNRGGVVDKIIGGWQVNGITTIRGGFPTDIRVGIVPPTFATFNVPNRVPGVDMYAHDGVNQYFNPAAFSIPGTVLSNTGVPIQTFGNSARHVGRGPGSFNTDFSVFKNSPITERLVLQFRAEFFDLTNTPTFFLASATDPTLTIGSPVFGKISNGTAVGRQIQFALKLIF